MIDDEYMERENLCPGDWTEWQDVPLVILDAAHNQEGQHE